MLGLTPYLIVYRKIMSNSKIWAVIPAAGIGSRMGSEIPKQYLTIGNKTILEHTLDIFLKHPAIYKVVVALHSDDRHWSKLSVKNDKLLTVNGGAKRVDSVQNSLHQISKLGGDDDWVMVHDAARPCLKSTHIDDLIKAQATSEQGAILAIPSFDTVKAVNPSQRIEKTIPRETVWLAQTPQFFPVQLLTDSINCAQEKNHVVTDEASAIELSGGHPALVIGSKKNIKVTEYEDLVIASLFLNHQS